MDTITDKFVVHMENGEDMLMMKYISLGGRRVPTTHIHIDQEANNTGSLTITIPFFYVSLILENSEEMEN